MTTYSFVDESGETRLRGTIDPAPGGGSQSFVIAKLQSSDGPNQNGSVPVLSPVAGNVALTMPLSSYGAGGNIRVVVTNDTDADVNVGGVLVGLDADGVYMERDTNADQLIAAGTEARVNFDVDGGGAVVGLAWNAIDTQFDVTGNGPFAATVSIYARPA